MRDFLISTYKVNCANMKDQDQENNLEYTIVVVLNNQFSDEK